MKFLVLILLFPLAYSQTGCKSGKNCSECIQIPGCAWCSDEKWTHDSLARCSTYTELLNTCVESHIQNPKGNVVSLKQESPQPELSPREITVKARVGEQVRFEAVYTDIVDKPLDLYYIMDVSATMKDDKETVASQAQNLASKLKMLTKEVRFGFGTFVDKPTLPYATSQQINGETEYEKPYAFRNQLTLTDTIARFSDVVRNTKISINSDVPEGCLEALVQAITCTEQIGWRNNTKLIVLSTDGTFKMAGAGKVIGIIPPNDLQCHMTGNEYTHALKQDYPSLAQLRGLIARTGVQVIFAVTEDVIPFYKRLEKLIPRGFTLLRIASDSKDIVGEVTKTYSSISSRVELVVNRENLLENDIIVTSVADCAGGKAQDGGGYDCYNVTPKSTIRYNFTMLLQKSICASKKRGIALTIQKSDQSASMRVNIEPICECKSCTASKALNDQYCSGAGEMICGICKCKRTHVGKNCECLRTNDIGEDSKRTTGCQYPKTLQVCTNRGVCNCGKCTCENERYQGKYCEKDQDDCKLPGTATRCSNQGTCNEGICSCNQFFEQTKFCNCLKSNSSCIEHGTSTVCSNSGTCVCHPESILKDKGPVVGKVCTCSPGRSGKYCESCRLESCSKQVSLQCQNKNVTNLVHCFNAPEETKVQEKAALEKRLQNCNKKYPLSVNSLKIKAIYNAEQIRDSVLVECPPSEKDSCILAYSYEYTTNGDELIIYLKNRVCPENKLWYILYVAGPLLLIGILTIIIWKVCTTWLDKKEFERFECERQNAQWAKGQNDLYVPPFSEFSNPAFRKSISSSRTDQ